MKKTIITLTVVTCVLLGTITAVEARDGRGHHGSRRPQGGQRFGRLLQDPEIAEKLGVTDAQIEAISEMKYTQRKQMIALKAKADLARLEQSRLLQQDEPDEEAILEAVEDVGKIQIAIEKQKVQQRLQVREILGAETIEKLKELGRKEAKKRHKQRRGRKQGGRRQGHQRHSFEPGPESSDDMAEELPFEDDFDLEV